MYKVDDLFVWKIFNFEVFFDVVKRKGCVIMLSKLFFLWKNGYMLKIRLEFRVYFLLFSEDFMEFNIVVVFGEFDLLLFWLFWEKLCLRLID